MTKPVVQFVLSAVIIYALFSALAVRRPQMVPGKGQFMGEAFHGIVRNRSPAT